MSRAVLIARARVAAEAGMVDACTVRHRTGETVDDNTGAVTATWADLYAGRCKVQQRTAQATQQEVGEDFQLLVNLEVHLPMSVTGLAVGDEVTITASAHDPDLPGQVFLVRDLFAKTYASARRVGVTRRTS